MDLMQKQARGGLLVGMGLLLWLEVGLVLG